MLRLSIAFLGTASAATVALALIQVQVVANGPVAAEPIARSVHEAGPPSALNDGH